MNHLQRMLIVAGTSILYAASAPAGNSKDVLWIELKSHDEGRTKIAVTTEIAEAFLNADKEGSVHINAHNHKDLITKEMIRDVLEGRRDEVLAEDPDNGSTARLYLGDLRLPRHEGSRGSIVMETYKNGSRTFRMKLGEFEISEGDKDDNNVEFSWKRLLPFLTKTGGALYINNEREDTEVWVFMD